MPEIINVSIVCDCGCGTIIASDAPRFVVEGWEILGSSIHGRGGRAIFAGPSHVATMASLLTQRYGDPLPVVSHTPDDYLVAHFAVQDMSDADLTAKWSDPALNVAWKRALTDECSRRPGWFAWSDHTYHTTAEPTAPGLPSNIVATPGAQSVSLSWTAPADGGSPITGYQITPNIGGRNGNLATIQTGSTATSFDVTGLTTGTQYTFAISAINARGIGAAAASDLVTPV